MKKIPLTNGGYTLVDDRDYNWASQYKWLSYPSPGGRTRYVIRTTNETNTKYGKNPRLHRLIMGIDENIDHINGDGLDNRRSNLRPADCSANGANRGKQANNTSGYKGVFLERATNHWFTQIRVLGKSYRFGVYLEKEEAAAQYDNVASQIFGEYAQLNEGV